MRTFLFLLLLLPASLFGLDILRGKPSDGASRGLVIVIFTTIDSVDGRIIHGQRVTIPDSTGARDTIPWQITVNWSRVDTLRGEPLELSADTLQMKKRYIAGVLQPMSYGVDSTVVAADSIWLEGR